jgi:hypothetical protein
LYPTARKATLFLTASLAAACIGAGAASLSSSGFGNATFRRAESRSSFATPGSSLSLRRCALVGVFNLSEIVRGGFSAYLVITDSRPTPARATCAMR